MLVDEGFKMVGFCGLGINNVGEVKVGMDMEEVCW